LSAAFSFAANKQYLASAFRGLSREIEHQHRDRATLPSEFTLMMTQAGSRLTCGRFPYRMADFFLRPLDLRLFQGAAIREFRRTDFYAVSSQSFSHDSPSFSRDSRLHPLDDFFLKEDIGPSP